MIPIFSVEKFDVRVILVSAMARRVQGLRLAVRKCSVFKAVQMALGANLLFVCHLTERDLRFKLDLRSKK